MNEHLKAVASKQPTEIDEQLVRGSILRFAKTKAFAMHASRSAITKAVFADVREHLGLAEDADIPSEIRFLIIGEIKKMKDRWSEHTSTLSSGEPSISQRIGDGRMKMAALAEGLDRLDRGIGSAGRPLTGSDEQIECRRVALSLASRELAEAIGRANAALETFSK